MFLLFKTYSLLKATCLLISFNKAKSFLWNTKNTDGNCINEQDTNTTYTEKDNIRKG